MLFDLSSRAPRRAALVTLAATISLHACTSDSSTPGPIAPTGGFTASVGTSALNVSQGASVSLLLKVTRTGGFSSLITFAVTGAPAGLSAAVQTVTPDSSRLVLTAADGVAAANYPIVVIASASGAAEQRSTIVVTVVPKPVSGPPGAFKSIAVGYLSTCAVSQIGAAYCWGLNGSGQLGVGIVSTDNTFAPSPTPLAVAGGLLFASLSLPANGLFACGIASSEAAYCWGDNSQGQLGDGTETQRSIPTPVATGVHFQSLAAGSHHVCGIAHDFHLYCWGLNSHGALGDGTQTLRRTPVAVAPGMTFKGVSAGDEYTCGLAGDGAAYCWGLGLFGQLGVGRVDVYALTPVPVSGGLIFNSLAIAGENACGVTADGTAYCWGHNSHGEVGDSTTTLRSTPVAVAGGHKFIRLSAGSEYFCGTTFSGDAYCWGYNAESMLGDGTKDNRSIPTLVTGGLKFRSVEAGAFHTCGILAGITAESSTSYCWGANVSGALGNGTITPSSIPVQVRFP